MNSVSLQERIELLELQLSNNNHVINEFGKNLYRFIQFIKLVHIRENDKWIALSNEYNSLKKQIKKNKKYYIEIINDFQIVSRYIDKNENDEIIKKLDNLKNIIDNNIFYILNLSHDYMIVYRQSYTYSKSPNIINISSIPEECKDYVNTIYTIHQDIIHLNSQIKKNKINILRILDSL
jgi:hypothetical protein